MGDRSFELFCEIIFGGEFYYQLYPGDSTSTWFFVLHDSIPVR